MISYFSRVKPFILLMFFSFAYEMYGQPHEQDTIVEYLINAKTKANEAPKEATPEYAKKLDSLLIKISYAKSDSIRIAALDNLFYYYYDISDFNGAKKVSDSIIQIAERTNDNNGRLIGYWGLADVQSRKGNASQALINYHLAFEALDMLQMSHQIKTNYQGGLLNNIAGIFLNFDDMDNSSLYYQKAIGYLIEGKDTSALATVYFNLSELFQQFKQFDKSYEYCKQSLIFKTKKMSGNNK